MSAKRERIAAEDFSGIGSVAADAVRARRPALPALTCMVPLTLEDDAQ
jgi:hypothetical protein